MSLNERLRYAEMKARHQKIFLPWYKKFWGKILIIFLIFLIIFITFSAIYVWREIKRIQNKESQTQSEKTQQAYLEAITRSGTYSIGATEPKINIVEFTDFTCPYCRQAALEIIPLLEEYKDYARLTIRDFPTNENSIDLAIAMRCAGEQDKYFEAYILTFTQQELLQETGDLLKANLSAWAQILDLNLTQFQTCFDERRYLNLIRQDYEDGQLLGIAGVPTHYINNYPIAGYYPANELRELFDGLLSLEQINETETN